MSFGANESRYQPQLEDAIRRLKTAQSKQGIVGNSHREERLIAVHVADLEVLVSIIRALVEDDAGRPE